MSLKKTAKQESPHAIFSGGAGWTYLVLKAYQTPEKEKTSPYARWLVAVQSPFTHGSFEMGDSYVRDVMNGGELVAATDEWLQAYGLKSSIPNPQQWLHAQNAWLAAQ